MTILQGDLKLMKAERLNDTTEGGGRMTGQEVVDGQSNNLFPDVSELDRVTGRIQLRKIFPAALTDNTDTYYGANTTVLLPPSDPNVGLCLMSTEDHHDTRAAARDVLERYLARGPKWRGFLYDTQLEGQRAIRFFQRVEVRLPEVGETLVLVGNEGKAGEFEQYVRILEVTQQLAKLQIPGVPEFTRNVVTCTRESAAAVRCTSSIRTREAYKGVSTQRPIARPLLDFEAAASSDTAFVNAPRSVG